MLSFVIFIVACIFLALFVDAKFRLSRIKKGIKEAIEGLLRAKTVKAVIIEVKYLKTLLK